MSVATTIEELIVPVGDFLDGRRRNPDHHLHGYLATRLGMPVTAIRSYRLLRRSVDARDHDRLLLRYRLTVVVGDDDGGPDPDAAELPLDRLRPVRPPAEVVIVGTGPAGLLAADLLIRHGVRPLLLERGSPVEERAQAIADFHHHRRLDPDNNLLYGEGGAGTYSDGKLFTRVRDPHIAYLLRALIRCRAPRQIRYDAHPHLGSDLLPHIVRRLRRGIEAGGGRCRWHVRVTDLALADGRCAGVRLADGEVITAGAVVLATGHGDRDLLRTLVRRGVAHRAKGWQLGCRVEHPQSLIDHARHGGHLPPWVLPAADYQLTSRPRDGAAGVTSFCMCPGGEILAATPRPETICTNGGSRFRRASGFANAALIVHRPTGDAMADLDFLDRLERDAWTLGGGDYTCPAQRTTAFLAGRSDRTPAPSSYRLGLRPARLDRLLPDDVTAAIAAALRHFDRRIPGYLAEGQLVGVETGVSSPLAFTRDPATLASSLPGLWLAGEGAGQAGGIVSAALDGLRIAERILASP